MYIENLKLLQTILKFVKEIQVDIIEYLEW